MINIYYLEATPIFFKCMRVFVEIKCSKAEDEAKE